MPSLRGVLGLTSVSPPARCTPVNLEVDHVRGELFLTFFKGLQTSHTLQSQLIAR